jgi:hypothetical protein
MNPQESKYPGDYHEVVKVMRGDRVMHLYCKCLCTIHDLF